VRALPPASTFVTASTGLAAAALGGTTLNAFAGVGRGDGGREAMLRAASRPDAAGRWRRAAVLVVDEVRRQQLGTWCPSSLRRCLPLSGTVAICVGYTDGVVMPQL